MILVVYICHLMNSSTKNENAVIVYSPPHAIPWLFHKFNSNSHSWSKTFKFWSILLSLIFF